MDKGKHHVSTQLMTEPRETPTSLTPESRKLQLHLDIPNRPFP